jgi:hypothetical protein
MHYTFYHVVQVNRATVYVRHNTDNIYGTVKIAPYTLIIVLYYMTYGYQKEPI